MTFEDIRPAINNSILTMYRVFAVITLYMVLAGVLMFGLVAAFYAVSDSWVAPVILSNADKDTLDLTSKLLVTKTTVEDLRLDIAKLQQTVDEAKHHRAALEALHPNIDAAIARENREKEETGPELVRLDEQKQGDNIRTQQMLSQLAEVGAQIDRELAAGLIDKTEAIQAKMALAKQTAELTDSKIATTLLKDNILDKTAATTRYLETLDKRAELESEIATLSITIDAANKQITTEESQVRQFDAAMRTVDQTPYVAAMQGGRVDVALVPYDNEKFATPGAPVYDCYLSFIVCRQVGTLRTTFVGEQHATHPIFRTDLRGVLAELELTNPQSAKSKTLFVGSKPLFF